MEDGESPVMVITSAHPSYFGDYLDGRVYRFPSVGFQKLAGFTFGSDEWVSSYPVSLDEATTIRVTNAEQPMAKGVQLFLVNGTPEQTRLVFEQIKQLHGQKAWTDFLKLNMQAGIISHENMRRGINPMNLDTGKLIAEEIRYETPGNILVDLSTATRQLFHETLHKLGI